MKREKPWNRCDICGKYIALNDFGNGATRVMITPDSDYSAEDYETTCKKCNDKEASDAESE